MDYIMAQMTCTQPNFFLLVTQLGCVGTKNTVLVQNLYIGGVFS